MPGVSLESPRSLWQTGPSAEARRPPEAGRSDTHSPGPRSEGSRSATVPPASRKRERPEKKQHREAGLPDEMAADTHIPVGRTPEPFIEPAEEKPSGPLAGFFVQQKVHPHRADGPLRPRADERGRLLPHRLDVRRPVPHQARLREGRAEALRPPAHTAAGPARTCTANTSSWPSASPPSSACRWSTPTKASRPTWTTEEEDFVLMRYTLQEAAHRRAARRQDRPGAPRPILAAPRRPRPHLQPGQVARPSASTSTRATPTCAATTSMPGWSASPTGSSTCTPRTSPTPHSDAERGKVTGTPVGCACGDGVLDWERIIDICREVPARHRLLRRVRHGRAGGAVAGEPEAARGVTGGVRGGPAPRGGRPWHVDEESTTAAGAGTVAARDPRLRGPWVVDRGPWTVGTEKRRASRSVITRVGGDRDAGREARNTLMPRPDTPHGPRSTRGSISTEQGPDMTPGVARPDGQSPRCPVSRRAHRRFVLPTVRGMREACGKPMPIARRSSLTSAGTRGASPARAGIRASPGSARERGFSLRARVCDPDPRGEDILRMMGWSRFVLCSSSVACGRAGWAVRG